MPPQQRAQLHLGLRIIAGTKSRCTYDFGFNIYAYAGENPLNYRDPTGLTTYVITTFDTTLGFISYGSHSALLIARLGTDSFLYDPAGNFQPQPQGETYGPQGSQRGSGGFLEGPLLPEYVLWQQAEGSQVQIVPLNTTAEQEAQIIKNAIDYGDHRGFSCAASVSSVFGEACGIKPTSFPRTLYNERL